MVLVGIGEEFNENFEDIHQFPNLMSALEEVDIDETLEWTIPFLEHRFLIEHQEGRLEEAPQTGHFGTSRESKPTLSKIA